MTAHDDALASRLQAEVVALHDFIAAWFRGALPKERALYERDFVSRLAPDLVNIQPAGRVLSRADLLEPIFEAHGANPDFAIAIRDFRLVTVSASGDLAVATYVEDQKNARNSTPPDNARRSTVVFKLDAGGERPLWLHLQETATTD